MKKLMIYTIVGLIAWGILDWYQSAQLWQLLVMAGIVLASFIVPAYSVTSFGILGRMRTGGSGMQLGILTVVVIVSSLMFGKYVL